MITLEDNQLVFRFPQVHERAEFSLEFQRTLRTPDDGKTYPLPAGLGSFPLVHVDDHSAKLPRSLTRRGGVLMPIWQSEAMWINFRRNSDYPFALKIATGKINAITGKPWTEVLNDDPQDYIVIPTQPWLDGYCAAEGIVRQFVAARLGDGVTVEEQITGAAEFGGLQVIAFPMKREVYERHHRKIMPPPNYDMAVESRSVMGLAPGGKIRQEVYEDPYGIDCWEQSASSRCFVSMVNAECWEDLTGMDVLTSPVTRDQYLSAGLPWFDYYDGTARTVQGSSVLRKLQSVFGGGEEAIPKRLKPLQIGVSTRPVREFDQEASSESTAIRLREHEKRLRQLSEAVAFIQEQIADAIASLSHDDEPSRCAKTILRVRFGGDVIIRQHASDTLAEVIRRIGVEKVRGLGLKLGGRPLIGTSPPADRGFRMVDGWVVATHASNADKKVVLEEIAKRLGTDIKVEVVQPVAL